MAYISGRFRTKKIAASPSTGNACSIETLAEHTANPSAHPDYAKKGAIPKVFDGSAHLSDKLAHCSQYVRRAELVLLKTDYEATKNTVYSDLASNYAAEKGVKRYIITSYVLYQILKDLGLDGSKSFLETNKIITPSSVIPTSGLDGYVPSYTIYKSISDAVEEIPSIYMTIANAAIEHAKIGIETTRLKEQIGNLGFKQTGDTAFVTSKTYYEKSGNIYVATSDTVMSSTKTYYEANATDNVADRLSALESSLSSIGTVPTGKTVMGIIGDTTQIPSATPTLIGWISSIATSASAAMSITAFNNWVDDTFTPVSDNVDVLKTQVGRVGYSLTTDNPVVQGKTYYIWNATNHCFEATIGQAGGSPVGLYDRDPSDSVTERMKTTETVVFNSSSGTYSAGTLTTLSISDLDPLKTEFDVVLIGTKNGVTHTFVNPTAQIADTSAGYTPIYVPAQSLVKLMTGQAKVFMPYSWLDLHHVSGDSNGIQDMTTLSIVLRTRKVYFE